VLVFVLLFCCEISSFFVKFYFIYLFFFLNKTHFTVGRLNCGKTVLTETRVMMSIVIIIGAFPADSSVC
jgi:hypothetical protein